MVGQHRVHRLRYGRLVNLVMTKVAFTSLADTDDVAQAEPYETYMDNDWTSTTDTEWRSYMGMMGHTVVV